MLTFEKPDTGNFRCLRLAYDALEAGGNMPCILNAANEIAVNAFLKDKIGFMDIPALIESCMAKVEFVTTPDLLVYAETDRKTRILAMEISGINPH